MSRSTGSSARTPLSRVWSNSRPSWRTIIRRPPSLPVVPSTCCREVTDLVASTGGPDRCFEEKSTTGCQRESRHPPACVQILSDVLPPWGGSTPPSSGRRVAQFGGVIRTEPSSSSGQPGLWATSQTYPSGSAKAPEVPPHDAVADGRRIAPPARRASSRVMATSSG